MIQSTHAKSLQKQEELIEASKGASQEERHAIKMTGKKLGYW